MAAVSVISARSDGCGVAARGGQLHRQQRPGRVAIEPGQVGAAQATREPGQDEGPDDGVVGAGPDGQVGDRTVVQALAQVGVERAPRR